MSHTFKKIDLMGLVRFFKILTWLRSFRVKMANFLRPHCLAIPRGDLSTKETKPNIVQKNDQKASESCYNFKISNVGHYPKRMFLKRGAGNGRGEWKWKMGKQRIGNEITDRVKVHVSFCFCFPVSRARFQLIAYLSMRKLKIQIYRFRKG